MKVFDQTASFRCGALTGSRAKVAWLQTLDNQNRQQPLVLFGLCSSLLIRCRDAKNLLHGQIAHAWTLEEGFEHRRPLANLILQMYASCGANDDAHSLFGSMPTKDIVSWNSMLALHIRHGQKHEANQLFQHMVSCDYIFPNRASFLIALLACDTNVFLEEGMYIHACIIETSLEYDVVMRTGLISMYGRCENVDDAWQTFTGTLNRDIIAWNAMLTVYAQNGHENEAMQLFHLLGQDDPIFPNTVTYLVLLDVCCSHAGLSEGKRIHTYIWKKDGSHLEISVGNALINMYNKCGSLDDARKLFDKMIDRNVISWTSLISALVQHGDNVDALQLFHQMQIEGVVANKITYITIFPAVIATETVIKGIQIHAVLGWETESDNATGNALINMYAKCGQPDLAHGVFLRMRDRDVVSWNVQISVEPLHSIQLFQQMQMECLIPNKATYISMLTGSASLPSLAIVKVLHAQIVGNQLDKDVMMVTTLVCMYGKHGFLSELWSIIDKAPVCDMIMNNAIIALFTQNGNFRCAFQHLCQCQMEGFIPDKTTFLSILDACGDQERIKEGKQMHTIFVCLGVHLDITVSSALIVMYGKCGRLEEIERVFEASLVVDVIAWNAMIVAFGYSGEPQKSVRLFEEMQAEGIAADKTTLASLLSVFANQKALWEGIRFHARIVGTAVNADVSIQNALISMYGKCGNLEEARTVFDRMQNSDLSSLNALIAVHVQCGRGYEALNQYKFLQQWHVLPDNMILNTMLSIFASEATLDDGRYLHACIEEIVVRSDILIQNALINMYGKCGSVEDARFVFGKMQQWDVVSLNAMIAVYALHGQADITFHLFFNSKFNNLIPDEVTMVSILSACSHGGLIDEGLWFFMRLDRNHGIDRTIDHYNCIIDLLGRAGRLHELECFLKCMPEDPTFVSWISMLDACRKHFDLERAEITANHIMNLQPSNCAPLVLLSNIYAHVGRWEAVTEIKEIMRERCVYYSMC